MCEKKFLSDGYNYVTTAIEEAIKNETRTATISGNWNVERAIRLPSNFTLILNDCHLRMADGCYSNIFVNQNHGTDIGKTAAGADRNINIIGRGEAVLDGGKYNGLSEKTQLKDGLPPVWKNNIILFTNVDGFKIEGIACRNQRWWALNFVYCANGYIGNIDICANDTMVDENGNESHGMLRERYWDVLVKNADGIDLRRGCHDIVIENITGFTGDDTIALTGLDGRTDRTLGVEDLPSDICNIKIRNIKTAAFCSNVRLLNQSGVKLHDIVIDGVYDMVETSPHMDKGRNAVRIGDTHLYGTRHSTSDETYNITIKNVRGGGINVISLAGSMSNLVMYGIESFNGAKMILDEREMCI